MTAGKSFFTFSLVLYSIMRNSNVVGQTVIDFCSCLDMLNCILEYFKVITKLLAQSKSNF